MEMYAACIRAVAFACPHGFVRFAEYAEDPLKHAVDAFEDRGSRTEILRERQGVLQFLRFHFKVDGTAAAEPVNRLFGIAHKEYLPIRNGRQDLLLHGIDVLIFVHKHELILFRNFAARLFPAEQFQSKML